MDRGNTGADLPPPSPTVERGGPCCSGERGEVIWDRNAQKHQAPLRDSFFNHPRSQVSQAACQRFGHVFSFAFAIRPHRTSHCPQGSRMQPAVSLA